MRKFCVMLSAVSLVLGVVMSARADDQANARAIIEKAIKASGGEEKLSKFHGAHQQLKGKFYGMGEAVEFTGESAVQMPDKNRLQVNLDVGGMKFSFIQIVNGNKGWMSLMGNTDELSKEQMIEAKHSLYTHKVEELIPLLKDKEFQLSLLGDVKVENKPAVGIKVARKGQRDVNLFFDKDKGLLVKSETRGKDPMQGDQEFTQSSLHSDFKEVQGVLQPMKVKVFRDDKLYIEMEFTEVKLADKLDDSLFNKP